MTNSNHSEHLNVPFIGRKGRKISFDLNTESLSELTKGSLACIWHRNWYDVEKAKKAISKLLAFGQTKSFEIEGVINIGPPIGLLLNSGLPPEKYFLESEEFLHRIRNEFFDDCQNPVDALLQALDGIWKAGAFPGSFEGKKLAPGIFRWYQTGSSLNPHIDRSNEVTISSFCSRARLTANIYLNTMSAATGGQLELWALELTDEHYECLRASDFSLPRKKIGSPALSISPAVGDLILFNAERIHAVSTLKQGRRLTASSFVGISDINQPIILFG